MYYGENVFVSHSSASPLFIKGYTCLFGKFLYTVNINDKVTLFCRGDKIINSVAGGILPDGFGYRGNIYKIIPAELGSKIAAGVTAALSGGYIADKLEIAYPHEEKYGVLLLKDRIDWDLRAVWIKKEFTPKYGPAVFEAAMQEWLGDGVYFNSYNGIVELAGTAYSKLHTGDVLMLIDDDAETKPKLFCIKEIIFRQKSVGEADPEMRGYRLIMTCDCGVNIRERAKFVKV